MNQKLQNKIDYLCSRKTNRNVEWVDFIIVLDNIVKTNILTIAQEILLSKIIDRVKKVRILTNTDCQTLILLLYNNGLNIFKSLNKGNVDNANKL